MESAEPTNDAVQVYGDMELGAGPEDEAADAQFLQSLAGKGQQALAGAGVREEDAPNPIGKGGNPGKGGPKKSQAEGQKKPNKKYRRQCRGCCLWFEDWAMATAYNLDHGCKNKVDNIYRNAKAQGKTRLVSDMRANDIKLQQAPVP